MSESQPQAQAQPFALLTPESISALGTLAQACASQDEYWRRLHQAAQLAQAGIPASTIGDTTLSGEACEGTDDPVRKHAEHPKEEA